MFKKSALFISGLILFAALTRLLPHAYNFTAIGAVALFGAAWLPKKGWALTVPLAVPLLALFLSDLILNNLVYASFYDGFQLMTPGFLSIYGAFVLIVLLAIPLFRKVTFPRVLTGALGASVVFFLVSNFGVWISSPLYPLTAEGLILCYTAAIPFFHYTVAGNLVYSAVLFGGFAYLTSHRPDFVPAMMAAHPTDND